MLPAQARIIYREESFTVTEIDKSYHGTLGLLYPTMIYYGARVPYHDTLGLLYPNGISDDIRAGEEHLPR